MTTDKWQMWEDRFAASHYVFGTAPSIFMEKCRPMFGTAGKALAVADGEGRNGVFLAECGFDVLSIDFSPAAQVKARALAEKRGVKIATEQADLLAWDWPTETYDVVAAIFIQFLTPPERARIFSAMKRALKPGGLLLLHGYRPEQLTYGTGGPSQKDHLYTRELLLESFGDLDDLTIETYDRSIEEGTGHSGMSALIDLTGRRPRFAARGAL